MMSLTSSRRSLVLFTGVLAAAVPVLGILAQAQSPEVTGPLVAYVGTFSSPLRDPLPTQVDLPPGNGRGIHLFQVNRVTGELAPAGIHAMATSPSCLVVNPSGTRLYSANETDRVGEGTEGTVSVFAIDRRDGKLKPLNTVPSGGAGPTFADAATTRPLESAPGEEHALLRQCRQRG